MTAASAILRGRRMAERQMADTCTVRTITGSTTNPLTGVDVPTYATVYPDPSWPADHPWKRGPCKVQTYEPFEQNPEAGGHTYTVQRYSVHVPVGAFAPAIGQVVTITAAALDPHLAGNVFRVVALLHKSAATAYRLSVEEVV